MPKEQEFTAIVLSLALLIATVHFVRKRKLREEYALLWLAATLVIFVLSVFSDRVKDLAAFFAVTYPPTLLLTLGLLFALGILLSQSVIITTLADRVRDLAQSNSILDWQVRKLETERSQVKGNQTVNQIEADLFPRNGSATVLPGQQTQALSSGIPARSRRVLVIGLDGATFDLIEPWAADGDLPALKHIMQHGAKGRLRSTLPPMTAPAWTSFATGTNPGKHGLYDWIARRPQSYRFSSTTALDCATPTIYTLLSEAGRRVCALNVPMTYPPVPVNGVMVSGLPAPSTRVPITYPAALYHEIVQNIGDYILYPDPGQAYSDAGVESFLKRLHRSGELRGRAFDYLRGRERWDFAMMVFNGTDTVSHAMWKYMDHSHPLFDPVLYKKYGNAIRDFYQLVDKYLAKVVKELDDDTTLVIMSDHGFGPFHKFIHVNNWLIQTGQMRLRSGVGSRLKAGLFQSGFAPMNVYDTLMRFGLGGLKREVVRGNGMGMLKRLFLSFDDVDWSRTRAYSLGNVGQINLNVAGREPQGCVQPGQDYERTRDEIIAQLTLLQDPATGEKVVEAIYRREEIYRGDRLEKAPDIVFIPRRLEYFGFGEYEFGSHQIIEPMKRGISGTHRLEGIFLAYGRDIRPGVQIEGVRIVDLAPTMLHLMGEKIPEHMDGRVLKEVFQADFQPVQSAEQPARWSAPEQTATDGLTAEDEQALAERLRNLGYVG